MRLEARTALTQQILRALFRRQSAVFDVRNFAIGTLDKRIVRAAAMSAALLLSTAAPANATSAADIQVEAVFGVAPWNEITGAGLALTSGFERYSTVNCIASATDDLLTTSEACIQIHYGQVGPWFRSDLGADSTGSYPPSGKIFESWDSTSNLTPRCSPIYTDSALGHTAIECSLWIYPIPSLKVTGLTLAKDLGSPSPPETPDDQSSSPADPSTPDDANPCGCGAVSGDPINTATGNLFEAQTDYTAAPVTGLALTRYYNSQDVTNSAFGEGWHSTWHRSLTHTSTSTMTVTRADGREDNFTLTAGIWKADPDVTSRLSAVPATGTQTGWRLVTADDTVESYALAGQLTSVTTRAGLVTRLAYNASGQLTTVTGPFGDRLGFVNDADGRVAQVTAPDGGVFTYAYDGNDNLVSVTHPDKSVRRYVYGDTAFPHALTGIIDEDGNAYASWTYDAQGAGDFEPACGRGRFDEGRLWQWHVVGHRRRQAYARLHSRNSVQPGQADGVERGARPGGRGQGAYL
ncbi:MAG: DUF6531 domain-containing protein [Stellaceae bacterium]